MAVNPLLIRPVEHTDLGTLLEFAMRAESGLTTLKPDANFLKLRIERAIASFLGQEKIAPLYLFILAQGGTRRVLGTCSITPKTLGVTNGYYYKLEIQPLDSHHPPLHSIAQLTPHRETILATELGGLYLSSEMRSKGVGRLLSMCRLLYLAMNPSHFEPLLFAELRGVGGANGEPPFWRGIASHFIDGTFEGFQNRLLDQMVDFRCLAPHPLFIPLLPKEVQEAIGVPHHNAEGARSLLKRIGLDFSGLIDCADGGPRYGAPVSELYIQREYSRLAVEVTDISESSDGTNTLMIASLEDSSRIAAVPPKFTPSGSLKIPASIARYLDLATGDEVGSLTLEPTYGYGPTHKHAHFLQSSH